MISQSLSKEELQQIKNNRTIRKKLCQKNHFWFFSIYLGHYINYPFAPFHHKMFEITEDVNLRMAVLVAFRGSAKSTIMTLSYPIWAVIGTQKKKFILIVSQTQAQARLHLSNIKKELETNELLKKDIGPFEECSDEWGANSIVISKYDARITAVSTEQSIRGIRHGAHRPDLIICDDIEDLQSVKTQEGRNRTFNWFNGEIIPVGDKNTKIIMVGNLLHEDCLILKLKQSIEEKKLLGDFYAFPLVNNNDDIVWPGKYSTMDDIEMLKKTTASETAFLREYMLKIVSDASRVIHPEWIHYYDDLPSDKRDDYQYTATGIDLAISQKESADYTAMVSVMVFGYAEELEVYVLPNPVNERLSFPETVERAKKLSKTLGYGQPTELYIEDVGYQQSLIQHLKNINFPAEGVKITGQDKRSRLSLISHLIQQGKVRFPRNGVEMLIQQLIGFGLESHDDLSDALSLLLLKVLEKDTSEPQLYIVECRSIH